MENKNRKLIAKYPLLKLLGKGGMGEVWLSHHPGLDIPVAVKILRTDNENSRIRFIQEGKLAASINHQNIVRVFDAGSEKDDFYLVMEFIEGEDYKVFADRQGGMIRIDLAVEMGIEICQALNVAHKNRVLHRDIKPENILKSFSGDIKLADLGIAKIEDSHFGNTTENSALGTPYYISPEQARDASSVDCRTDIYSLGATLYRLLTGTYPFKANTPIQMLMKHINEPLEKPEIRNANIPLELSRIICKMMEKNTELRYQSCTEVLNDLAEFKEFFHNYQQVPDELGETMGATLEAISAASISIYTKEGKGIHVYSHDVELGRSRKADIMTRNYPSIGSQYSQEDIKLINIKISSIHAQIKIEDDGFSYSDCSSRNGSSVDGINVAAPVPLLKSGHICLAPETASEHSLNYRNLNNQALILSRTDNINDYYIIVRDTFKLGGINGIQSDVTFEKSGMGLAVLKNGIQSDIANIRQAFKEISVPARQHK